MVGTWEDAIAPKTQPKTERAKPAPERRRKEQGTEFLSLRAITERYGIGRDLARRLMGSPDAPQAYAVRGSRFRRWRVADVDQYLMLPVGAPESCDGGAQAA